MLSVYQRGADVNALPLAGSTGLLAVLSGLTDPRKKRGVRHQVASILTIVAAAALAGCRSLRSVADFAADLPPDALQRLGARRHPVTGMFIAPSEPTIRRTVQGIDADEADQPDRAVADGAGAGRAARRSGARPDHHRAGRQDPQGLLGGANTGNGKVRLFSALVHGEGVVVGQRAIPEGTTEVSQVIPLLEAVAGGARTSDGRPDLNGKVITADALHVHKANIEELTGYGGEFVLTVKGNNPLLREKIASLFPADGSSPHHLTFYRCHGRTEIRSIWCTSSVAGLDFPGVYQAFRIHREIFDLDRNPLRKPETVHGITSFTAWQANPADVLARNRGHWEVENREHYVRDVTFDEDRSQLRTGAAPQVMATMRNIAISLLRLTGWKNIKQATEKMSRRVGQILTLLGV